MAHAPSMQQHLDQHTKATQLVAETPARLEDLNQHSLAAETALTEALRHSSRVREEVHHSMADSEAQLSTIVTVPDERIQAKVVFRNATHTIARLSRSLQQLEAAATQAVRPPRY